jgi:hypothetical protein
MGRATPPFRADHVGSLLRPPRLLQARDDHAAGRISDEELRAVEDDAIRDVVAMQRDAGLQSATDGEFRRASWHMDFIYRLGGVSRAPEHLKVQFRNPTGTLEFTSAALKIDGKVHLEQTVFGEDFPGPAGDGDLRHSQAHHPVAEHGPLPRRPGGDRPRRLPRPGAVLERPGRRLRRASPAHRRAGLHLPPVRRHQPRLPQRPGAAGDGRRAWRRRRALASALHPADQPGAGGPGRRG